MNNEDMTNKEANTTYEIHELLKKRWSPRAFADTPVSEEVIGSILEAGRWAMSSYNEQPWRYIVARKEDTEAFNRILSCLVEFNQNWASGAPLLMLSFGKTYFGDDVNKTNPVWQHDIGAASAYMVLEAMRHEVYTHQMSGLVEAQQIKDTFDPPEGFEPATALAFGYHGKTEQLSENLQKGERAPREREDLGDVFFSGEWGTPLF